MRDWKWMTGSLALGVAGPAWASDMTGLAGLLVLPPVCLWALIAALAGLLVRTPTAATVWAVLLVLGGFPAFGATLACALGSFHGSELHHEGLFAASGLALVALIASYAWFFWRVHSRPPPPEDPPPGAPS